jgi:beta-lactamase regulating signal transducer with metallopeptidase domain
MNLPYTMRLLCLCWATFFMVHMVLALVARFSAGTAVRVAEHMKPRSAARLLFVLRTSPWLLTLLAVLVFCIPSYLWLEPEATGERVSLICMVMALAGVSICASSLIRAWGAFRGTVRYLQHCQNHGRKVAVRGEAVPALLLKDKAPVVAVAGVFRPQLVISRSVMRGLSHEEREAALRHEQAHCLAGDNLKRFLILLSPDPFPFVRTFGSLERAWSRFTEWAADDHASEGDPQRALSLASALVRVAKMGSKPKLGYLSCSLLGGDHDLAQRVDRLLRPQKKSRKPVRELVPLLTGAGALVTSAVAVITLWPGSLALVHRALEALVH